jgi:hypothetical protein
MLLFLFGDASGSILKLTRSLLRGFDFGLRIVEAGVLTIRFV